MLLYRVHTRRCYVDFSRLGVAHLRIRLGTEAGLLPRSIFDWSLARNGSKSRRIDSEESQPGRPELDELRFSRPLRQPESESDSPGSL